MLKKVYLFLSLFAILFLLMSFSCVAYATGSESPDTGGFFGSLLEFVKGVFIPSDNYFHNQVQRLQEKVNVKIGGVGYLYNMLKNFFSGMVNTSASTPIMFSIPDNSFFSGYKGLSVDVLTSARPYLNFLRAFLNVAVCLLTSIVCYKRLTALFQE